MKLALSLVYRGHPSGPRPLERVVIELANEEDANSLQRLLMAIPVPACLQIEGELERPLPPAPTPAPAVPEAPASV